MEKEEHSDLTYDGLDNFFKINPKGQLPSGDYMAFIPMTNKDFICFIKLEERGGECPEGKIFKKHGLKFHIALPEFDMEMYKRAWDIVRDTLMNNEVESFKIVKPGLKMSDTPGQEGKDITVYADAEPGRSLEDWQDILQQVTQNLVNANILPGYRAPGTEQKPELPVDGTNYVTYRYYDELKKVSNWPKPDPCRHLSIRVDGPQPEIPVLAREEPIAQSTHMEKSSKFE